MGCLSLPFLLKFQFSRFDYFDYFDYFVSFYYLHYFLIACISNLPKIETFQLLTSPRPILHHNIIIELCILCNIITNPIFAIVPTNPTNQIALSASCGASSYVTRFHFIVARVLNAVIEPHVYVVHI